MHILDLSGLHCPHVVLRLADHMRGMAPGETLSVIATDPLSAIDVPFFLDKTGHRLVSRQREGRRLLFVVARGDGPGSPASG